jgi:hypothetical protein
VKYFSDCQLFYRRARLNALMLGSRYAWQDRLIAALQRQKRRRPPLRGRRGKQCGIIGSMA